MVTEYRIECNPLPPEILQEKLDEVALRTPSLLPFQRKQIIGLILLGTILTGGGIIEILLFGQLTTVNHFVTKLLKTSLMAQQIVWPIYFCGGIVMAMGLLILALGLAQMNRDEPYIP